MEKSSIFLIGACLLGALFGVFSALTGSLLVGFIGAVIATSIPIFLSNETVKIAE